MSLLMIILLLMFIRINRNTNYRNEHSNGNWRSVKREATVQECTQIANKDRMKTKAVWASKLKVSRDPKNGYAATFEAYVDNSKQSARKGGQ